MKRIIYLSVVLFALSAITSCTSYNYYTAAINKTNMSGYHSFAWMPNNGQDKMGNGIYDATVKDAATAALTQKGLRLNQRNPDLLVMYTAKVGVGTKTNYYSPYYGGPWYGGWGGWGFGYGFGWGWGFRYRPYYYYGAPFGYYGGVTYADKEHYKEGTLIIDLVDTRTHRVVWRGFGVGDAHNTEKTIKDLPKVVDGILSQLNITAYTHYNGMRS